MTVAMFVVGALLIGTGAAGYRKLDEMVPALPDPEERAHRERVLRRGTIAFQVMGVLLLVVAVLMLLK